jgi:polyisoprenoid-binding protein YceI
MGTATHDHTATLVPAGTWSVDPERSTVAFSIRHMLVSTVRGRFTDFDGTIARDERGTHVHGRVRTASIDSGNDTRDDRVRGEDFLDAAGHPEMRFVARHVERVGTDAFRIAGELTIAGVTRPLELTAVPQPDGDGRAFAVRGSLRRSDFGIEPKSLLEAGVSDRVDLALEIHADPAAR